MSALHSSWHISRSQIDALAETSFIGDDVFASAPSKVVVSLQWWRDDAAEYEA
jgi:hypothetical protein